MTQLLPMPEETVLTDPESLEWVSLLKAGDDAAIERLHALLLRAARHEIARRRRTADDDLAWQAADDALAALLAKLHTYRGASRFTTWAYKFALLEAGVKLRRRAWEGREIPLEDGSMEQRLGGRSPHGDAEAAELLRAVADGIRTALTAHQREVLVALTLNDVPIDVLAERLGTTRGALYKSLHDARHKLRHNLSAGGFGLDWLEEETR